MGDPWNEGGFSGEDEWDAEESVEDKGGDEDEEELTLDLEELGPDEPDDEAAG
jgi:hypothetical protein